MWGRRESPLGRLGQFFFGYGWDPFQFITHGLCIVEPFWSNNKEQHIYFQREILIISSAIGVDSIRSQIEGEGNTNHGSNFLMLCWGPQVEGKIGSMNNKDDGYIFGPSYCFVMHLAFHRLRIVRWVQGSHWSGDPIIINLSSKMCMVGWLVTGGKASIMASSCKNVEVGDRVLLGISNKWIGGLI